MGVAPASSLTRRQALVRLTACAVSASLGLAPIAASAQSVAWAQTAGAPATRSDPLELQILEADWGDDGVVLRYSLRLALPRHMEEALLKGVPLYFVAEAEVQRQRWYWTDRVEARATRTWRVAWQPLARTWRVSFGGLHQHYASLSEALAVITRAGSWKIAEAGQVDEDARYRVDFSWRLDTSQLPRPLQLGLGGDDWDLALQRTVALREPEARK